MTFDLYQNMSRFAADVPSALFVRALEALPLFIKIFEPRTNAFLNDLRLWSVLIRDKRNLNFFR